MRADIEPCYLCPEKIFQLGENQAWFQSTGKAFFYHTFFLHFLLEDEESKFQISS
jgi:hypothetical protein